MTAYASKQVLGLCGHKMVQGMAREGGSHRGIDGRFGWRVMAVELVCGYVSCETLTWITLVSGLMLQRFVFPAGGSLKISIATPLVLGATGWALLCNSIVIERRRLSMYLGLLAVAFLSTAVQYNLPLAIAPRMSLTSLAYWLAITAFAVVRFRQPMGERTFFGMVSLAIQIVAVAGVAQFMLQFVGIRLFEFTGIVQDRFLNEDQFAVVLGLEGGLFRSNGFFLVEPSVFSQVMALGIIVEAQVFRRPGRFALFFAGLLMSVSGTGWLVLSSYVLVLAIGAGPRGLLGAIALAAAGAIAFGGLSLALPDIAEAMTSRLTEFTYAGTSGNERFVTPFMALNFVWTQAEWAAFTGTGPGSAEQLMVPFFYRMNAPVKILIEYGLFGLFFYLGLLLRGTRTSRQFFLLPPCLVLLLVAGGYHQFSPILFIVVLLCDCAFLKSECQ